MKVKEYTRVIKDNIIIFRQAGFQCIKDINRQLNCKDKYRIEYIITDSKNIVLCALFMFHGTVKVGSVFPYGYFQNNN
jgi:hypothetical protein